MKEEEEFDQKIMDEVIREMNAVHKICTWDNKNEPDPNYYPCVGNFCHECKHQLLLFNN